MAKLKIRIELSKGRRGIPLGKLSKVAEETLSFLKSFHNDAQLAGPAEAWLAYDFTNNSVDFDCECMADVEIQDVQRANAILRVIMTNDRSSHLFRDTIRPGTRRQYSKIAETIEPDEQVSFGLFSNGEREPKEKYSLTKSVAYDIETELPTKSSYYGQIQGIIHAFYKSDSRLVVRELSSRALIDCYFADALYADVVRSLEDREGIVFIEGDVEENMVLGIVESIRATAFRMAPHFDEKLFHSLIGSAPDLTGNLSTEEFVARHSTDGFPT